MSNDLCEELIVEIFSRLPSKSLLRFRSLSKPLCDCIDSPSFIRLHTLRSPKKVMIRHKSFRGIKDKYTLHSEDQLHNNSYIGITPVDYPFLSYNIVGSCNGIVCLNTYGDYGIILWNPSIRRKVIVQPPNDNAYNLSTFRVGFGFDPVVDDYKISWMSKQQTTFVYTLKRDTWHEISSPTPPFSYVSSYQCLFNGALHYAVERDLTDYHIIKFDLSSEVFSTIELPEPSWVTSVVTTIDNRLAVMSSKHDDTRVWVMGECNSWSAAFNLNTIGVNRVIQVTTNDALLLNTDDTSIFVYDPKTNMQSTLVGLNDSSFPLSVTMCIESLRLLDIGTPC